MKCMKRVLIITYYWPPTGGSGVQRWLKFAKYMPSLGWQPVVLTPENPDIGLLDQSLMNDIPPEAEVIKIPISDPSKIIKNKHSQKDVHDGYSRLESTSWKMRFAKWIRGNFFIPDSRILWVKPAVSYLNSYLRNHPVDLIVSTGPPHSMHLIAERVVKRNRIKWILDLRDPMSQMITNEALLMSTFALKRYRKIESRLLHGAHKVLSTSPGMLEVIEHVDAAKFKAITNGYDAADFERFEEIRKDKLILVHAGLLSKYRIPYKLLEVLEKLIKQGGPFFENMEFHLAGIVSPLLNEALEHLPRLKSKTQYHGYLSHKNIITFYQRASLLLLSTNDDMDSSPGTIPGKLFEYMAARRPILSLGPTNSVYEPFFRRDTYSAHFSHTDYNGISSYLRQLQITIENYSIEENPYLEFERQKLTKELVDFFNHSLSQ